MAKTVLITGATDGIGLETAKRLVKAGCYVLLHGRSIEKLQKVESDLLQLSPESRVQTLAADLSDLGAVKFLAQTLKEQFTTIDVLINNAGVLKTEDATTAYGIDLRFVVNVVAPYLLTKELLPLLGEEGLVLNLSSAAQAPVDLNVFKKDTGLDTMKAYAQSKLALIMWANALVVQFKGGVEENMAGPTIISVNPGSLLGTKMVKEQFGTEGKDVGIGAQALVNLVMETSIKEKSGQYFDNDKGVFALPHADACNPQKNQSLVSAVEEFLTRAQIH